MSELKFELIASVAWGEDGLQDRVLYASTLEAGAPKMLARVPPDVLRGADGTLWLAAEGRVLRLGGADSAETVTVTSGGGGEIGALVPTEDGGLVVLGEGDDTKWVLTRLSSEGEVVWRRQDVGIRGQRVTDAQLLGDRDGSVFLYAISGGVGEVFQVDLREGSVRNMTAFDREAPENVWVDRGCVFRVVFSNEGAHRWVRRDLASSEEHAVGSGPLQYVLDWAQGPLPDGGAILAVVQKGELIWMDSEGFEARRLSLAGLVRDGEDVVVGVRDEGCIRSTRWRSREAVGSSVRTGPFESSFARLIAAEAESLYVLDSGELSVFDSTGAKVEEVERVRVNEERLSREGTVSIGRPVVEPSGAVLVVGADPRGAYVVRIGA